MRTLEKDSSQTLAGALTRKMTTPTSSKKNWTHVRRLLGYQRYDSPTALEALNNLYSQELRSFKNYSSPRSDFVAKYGSARNSRGSMIRPKLPSNGCAPPSS